MTVKELEELVETYGTAIYSFCCYLTGSVQTAEDLYQNILLKALEKTVLDMDLEKNVLHLAVTDHSQVIKEKGIIEWSLYLSNLMDSETNSERILEGTYSVSMQIQTKELLAKIIKDSRFGKEGSLKITPMSMDLKMILPYREAKSFTESLSGKAATVPFVLLKNGEKVLCDIDGDSVRLEFEDEKDRKAEVFARFSFEKPIEPEEVKETSVGLPIK